MRNSWGGGWGEKGYIRISRANDAATFVDKRPADGVACAPAPKTQTVGGECGILLPLTTHGSLLTTSLLAIFD